jgi:hypothetical protein
LHWCSAGRQSRQLKLVTTSLTNKQSGDTTLGYNCLSTERQSQQQQNV